MACSTIRDWHRANLLDCSPRVERSRRGNSAFSSMLSSMKGQRQPTMLLLPFCFSSGLFVCKRKRQKPRLSADEPDIHDGSAREREGEKIYKGTGDDKAHYTRSNDATQLGYTFMCINIDDEHADISISMKLMFILESCACETPC